MSDINWYNTVGGRRFVDQTVPSLVESINSLAETNRALIDMIAELSVRIEALEEKMSFEEKGRRIENRPNKDR